MLRQIDLVPYFFTRAEYTVGGDVPVIKNCNGIVVVNIGTVIAFVNGFPLNPRLVPGMNGESWTVGGNFGEIVGEENLEITFGGGAGSKVFVSMKYYKKIC
jgi:hypothetical protein